MLPSVPCGVFFSQTKYNALSCKDNNIEGWPSYFGTEFEPIIREKITITEIQPFLKLMKGMPDQNQNAYSSSMWLSLQLNAL